MRWTKSYRAFLFFAVLTAVNALPGRRSWNFRSVEKVGSLEAAPVKGGLCDASVKSLSGYYKVTTAGKSNQNYFFWFFEARNQKPDTPTAMWLTGGPGCSSMMALLAENGPCTVNKNLTTTPNPASWNNDVNIMWVDQPTGVGFSYGDTGDYDHDEAGVAEDMYHFLQSFFDANPSYRKNRFFVFGESYGGHYVPSVANRVFIGNQAKEDTPINLAGIGIGNGLTNPEVQYQYYAEMAYNNSYGIKTVSKSQYDQMVKATPACIEQIKKCQQDTSVCAAAQTSCNNALIGPYEQGGLNPYDIRKPCGSNPLCYDFSQVTTFLNQQSTLDALHVSKESAKWTSCNYKVNADFASDWMKEFEGKVAPMLEGGVQALVYAGDVDFICNWMGNKAWTLALPWSGKAAFNAAADRDWVGHDGSKAGTVRSANGLTFLQINKAGHMVPMDQPDNALLMFNTFTSGGKF